MTDVENPTASRDEQAPPPDGREPSHGEGEPRMRAQLALFIGLLVFLLVGLAYVVALGLLHR
jgi:hypothetical protein